MIIRKVGIIWDVLFFLHRNENYQSNQGLCCKQYYAPVNFLSVVPMSKVKVTLRSKLKSLKVTALKLLWLITFSTGWFKEWSQMLFYKKLHQGILTSLHYMKQETGNNHWTQNSLKLFKYILTSKSKIVLSGFSFNISQNPFCLTTQSHVQSLWKSENFMINYLQNVPIPYKKSKTFPTFSCQCFL